MTSYGTVWTHLDEILFLDSLPADRLAGYAEGIGKRANWDGIDKRAVKDALLYRMTKKKPRG